MLTALLALLQPTDYVYFIVSAIVVVVVDFDTIVPVNGGQQDF